MQIIVSQMIFQVPPVSDPPAVFSKQRLLKKAGITTKELNILPMK